jgi:hypothetical protein
VPSPGEVRAVDPTELDVTVAVTLDPDEEIHVAAPAGFRRFILLVAIAVVGLELWASWIAARLTALLQGPGTSDQALQVFVVFRTALTLQVCSSPGI